MQTMTLMEAKARLEELVVPDGRNGEIVITLDDRPVAKLTPLPASAPSEEQPGVVPRPDRGYGCMRGQIVFHPGWDEPLGEFDDYR